MLKKVIKSLTTTESMMSLVINIVQIPTLIIGVVTGKITIISLAILTILISVVLFFRIAKKTAKKIEKENELSKLKIEKENESARIENEISIFISNNEKRARAANKYPSFPLNEKKDWMFLKLSKKFPEITCLKLQTLIDKHYELIGDQQ